MYNESVAYLVDIYTRPDLELNNPITDEAKALFEQAEDICLMYRGDMETLIEATRYFLATKVRAYVYAGAAEVIIDASYISGGNYEPAGLKEAERFLNMALKEEPNRFDILRIKAFLASVRHDAPQLRKQLDRLHQMPEAEKNARLAILEIAYCDLTKKMDKAREWMEKTTEFASNNVQAVFALNALAGSYLRSGAHMNDALQLYQRIVQLSPSDAWAWHNMSVICLRQNDLEKAGFYNRKALDIAHFGAAESIREGLLKKWKNKIQKDPLEEVPRFLSPGATVPNIKAHVNIVRRLLT